MKKDVIFHIGLEKTGTTSFQKFCKQNRSELLRHSVLYPTRNFAFHRFNHNHLAASYLAESENGQRLARSKKSKDCAVQSIRAEIDVSGASIALISAEHFSSRFLSKQIQELADDFLSYNCQIVIVIRDHVSRVLSAYYTTILAGRYLSLHEFVNEVCDPGNLYARYKETIIPWEVVFGRRNIRIIDYDSDVDITSKLSRTIVSTSIKLHKRQNYNLNQTPGAAKIESLRAINEEYSDVLSREFSRYDAIHRARRILYSIKKRLARDCNDKLELSGDDLRRIEEIAEIDRDWLKEYHFSDIAVLNQSDSI